MFPFFLDNIFTFCAAAREHKEEKLFLHLFFAAQWDICSGTVSCGANCSCDAAADCNHKWHNAALSSDDARSS